MRVSAKELFGKFQFLEDVLGKVLRAATTASDHQNISRPVPKVIFEHEQ